MTLIKKSVLFFATFLCSVSALAQIPGHWERHQLPANNIGAYFFPDSVSIFAVASKLCATTDGGVTWDSAEPQSPFVANTGHVFTVPALSSIYAFQKVRPLIINSTDHGKTWSVVQDTIPLFTYAPLFSMWSPTSGALFLRSDTNVYELLVTHDGCKTFDEIPPDTTLRYIVAHAPNAANWAWADSMNGILWNITASNNRHLAVTHDGGRHWSVADERSPSGDTNISHGNRPGSSTFGAGVFTLAPNRELPYYYYSTDLGDHWQATDTSAPTELEAVSASSRYSIWSAGWKDRSPHEVEDIGVLLFSSDYGKHWLRDTTTFWDYGIKKVQFIDSTHGYVVAGFSPLYLFRYSTDLAQVHPVVIPHPSITLFPNPCLDDLNVFSEQAITQISIYDVLGSRVLHQTNPAPTISLKGLSANQYFLELTTALGRQWKPFLKVSP